MQREQRCLERRLSSQGLYRHINETELGWLGCSRDEVIGKLGPRDFFTDESKALFAQAFPIYLRTGHVEGLEFDLVSRDGTVRRLLAAATAVNDTKLKGSLSSSVMYDITELHQTRTRLKTLADQLEARVKERTNQLRLLAANLEAAENRERQQLARDLHDDLGQTLAAARIRLSALCVSDHDDVRDCAVQVAELIDRANIATRSLAAQLAPAVLYELGLVPALEWLSEEIERTFGLRVSVMDDGRPKPLSAASRSIVYRATRELLINAAKHAGAHHGEVEVERSGEDIVVRVSDAGVGFDPAQVMNGSSRGQGLVSVRERLSFIGGTARIDAVPGDGTVATLTAPLTLAAEPTTGT